MKQPKPQFEQHQWPVGGGEMGTLFREMDWSQTPLGPIERWPQSLKTAVDIALAHRFPAAIAVGHGAVALYNDAYARMIGSRHPGALGHSVLDVFTEVRHLFEPILGRVWCGETVVQERQLYPFIRNGALEDAWFTITYAPLRNESGAIIAVFSVMIEVTAQVLAERRRVASEARQTFLLHLTDHLRSLSDPTAIMAAAAKLLGRHFGVAVVQYLVVGADGDTYTVAAQYSDGRLPHVPAQRGRISDHGSGWGPELRSGKEVFSDDHATRPADAEASRAFGVLSGSAVPLIRDGRLVAIFSTGHSEPRRWTDAEMTLQREVAERTWAAVERACAEAALRASEENYRALFETMDQGFCLIERIEASAGQPADFRYLTANPAFERHTGMHDVVGKTIRELVPGAEQSTMDLYDGVARTGQLLQFEAYVSALDLWMEAHVVPTHTPGQIAVLFTNVSDRKRAEEALRASEQNLHGVANIVPDLLWHSDPDGSTTWYNERWMEYTGQTFEQAIGWGWMAAIHPDDREASARRYREAVEHNIPLQQEQRIRRHDGMYRWFLVRAEPLRDEEGRIVRMYGAATDIHEQRAEREELEARVATATAQLRDLSRQLLTVQEEERRHLARELHDEIGQALTGLQLRLDAVSRAVGPRDVSPLADADALVRVLTAQVRTLSMSLRPAALDTLGLAPALLGLIEGYQKNTSVVVDLRHHGLDRRFSTAVEITAYRVVQEALTNVARHAHVAAVAVQALAEGGMLTVTIRDDGCGFDTNRTSLAGGLGGMRERVGLLGGTLVIESRPGAGTLVAAELPLEDEAAGEVATARHEAHPADEAGTSEPWKGAGAGP